MSIKWIKYLNCNLFGTQRYTCTILLSNDQWVDLFKIFSGYFGTTFELFLLSWYSKNSKFSFSLFLFEIFVFYFLFSYNFLCKNWITFFYYFSAQSLRSPQKFLLIFSRFSQDFFTNDFSSIDFPQIFLQNFPKFLFKFHIIDTYQEIFKLLLNKTIQRNSSTKTKKNKWTKKKFKKKIVKAKII